MIGAIAFWLFLLSACVIIYGAGDRVARWFLIAVIAATASTFICNGLLGFLAARSLVLVTDVALLAVALFAMTISTSFWPIWFAGFQSITVATELAQISFPHRTPQIYIDAAGFWALPALICMVAGVLLDRRMVRPVR